MATDNSSSTHAPEFAAFYREPTPANAVALARADHRSGLMCDWAFVDQLRKAEAQCLAHYFLVTALRRLRTEFLVAGGEMTSREAAKLVDDALDKATPQ